MIIYFERNPRSQVCQLSLLVLFLSVFSPSMGYPTKKLYRTTRNPANYLHLDYAGGASLRPASRIRPTFAAPSAADEIKPAPKLSRKVRSSMMSARRRSTAAATATEELTFPGLEEDLDLAALLNAEALSGADVPEIYKGTSTEDLAAPEKLITGFLAFGLSSNQPKRTKRGQSLPVHTAFDKAIPMFFESRDGRDLWRQRRKTARNQVPSFLLRKKARAAWKKTEKKEDIISSPASFKKIPDELKMALLGYLLNQKNNGHTIQVVDINDFPNLEEQKDQNVVCKVAPYRVCYQRGENGKLRPLRKAQPMNIMRVYKK